MKYSLAIATLLFSTTVGASPALKICHGEYALCAASSTVPVPGKTITVNGKTFPLGVAVCPVLTGDSIGDMNLMNNSCDAPAGKVWSLFSTVSSYPQAPSWAVAPTTFRTFTTTAKPGGGMSNMWSFLCVKRPQPVNGVTLADCEGPMNESPWTGAAVPPGTTVTTSAPAGAANPVGGPIP